MKRIYGILAAAAALLAAQCALAAAPGRVSYQGTLRKDGRLYSGTAAMEFRLVNADASETYWSSGSTDVVVSTGLFRYPLGTPNEAQFALVNWKDITPYVQMRVDGAWLPAEPLYSSVYALHAATAESSTGTFTVNEGNLRLAAGAAGTRGVAFPDGTVQYYAPGWAVAPTLTYTSFAGSAALGLATPQARLDVQSAPGDQYAQIWRDSSGAEVASMTVAGRLFADGSAIRQLPGGADSLGTHVATMTLLMGGNPIANAGAVTASGALTTYSSATVASPLGLGAARVELRPGVALSSAPASAYGGLYISSHVYLPPGGRYYGDGSALSGIVSFDSLGTHVATTTLQMGGNPIVNAGAVTAAGALTSYSSATVASALGLGAPRLQLAPGVVLSSAAAAPYGGVYFSSHVYLPPGVRIYGDGTGLTGLTGIADNLGSHLATTTLRMDGYPISGVGELTVAGSITTQSSVTVTGAPGLGAGRLQLRPGVALSSAAASVYGGIYISSHVFLPAGARYYGDGTALSLNAGTLASGTLPDARLSSNVLMKDSTQTLTGAAAFSSSAAFTLQHAALPGVYVSSGLVVGAGSLGVGTAAPLEKLDVAGAIRIGNTGASNAGAIKYAGGTFQGYNGASWLTLNGSYSVDSSTALWGLNSAVTPNTVYMVGLSSSLAIGGMDAGASKLRVTGSGATSASSALLAENSDSAQIFLVRDDGRIAAGPHAPEARLDVRALAGDGYAQVWRDQAGAVVSSLSVAGVLYADAAGLRGLPPGADDMGDHTAAQDLDLARHSLLAVASVAFTGDGLRLGTDLTSAASGLFVSTSGALQTLGAGSGSVAPDARGHGAVDLQNARANSFNVAAGAYSVISGGRSNTASGQYAFSGGGSANSVSDYSAVTGGSGNSVVGSYSAIGGGSNNNVGGNNSAIPGGSGNSAAGSYAFAGGYAASSAADGAFTWADSQGVAAVNSAADMVRFKARGGFLVSGSTSSAQSGTADRGLLVTGAGLVGVANSAPQAALDVVADGAGASAYAQIWRDSSGVIQASMTAAGVLYAEGSALRGISGGNVVDTLAATLGAGSSANSGYINNLSSAAVGRAVSEAALDAQAVTGDAYVQIWRDSAGVIQASMTAAGLIYADGSRLRGLSGGGNIVDDLGATLGAGSSANSGYINNLSSAAVGRAVSEAALDAQAVTGDAYVQIWRDSAGVIQASMTAAGLIYADGSRLRGLAGGAADDLGDHTATQHLDLAGFMLLNASTVTVAAGRPWIAFSTTVLLAGNLYASGGAVLKDGPLGIGIQQPLASLHVSSEAGYSGNMVLVSTGVSTVFRVTGGGEVYSTKYYGDGSLLTGILASPMQANLDMNGREIVNLNSVTISSRIVAGNQASEPLQQAVLMVLDLVEEKDIGTGDEMNDGSPNSGISAALMVKPVNAHNALELAMAGDFAVAMQDEATGTFPVLAGLRSTVMQRAPGTFVSAGYGLLTRTMVLGGTLDNVFGVYISSPTGPGTVTNNTGLHIADQSGSGVPFGHNIVSAGADSVNYFEGLIQSSAAVVSSRLAIPVMNEADFGTRTPQGAGEVYLCNGCTDTFLVISTGATRGGFAGFSKAASIN